MINLTIERMVPLLCVHDVRQSIAFYRDILGFELKGTYPDNSDDPGFATFERSDVRMMVNSDEDPSERTDATDIQRSHDITLYLWTKDLDSLRASLLGHQVDVGDVEVQHYGMKQLPVSDPDGFKLVFQEGVEK